MRLVTPLRPWEPRTMRLASRELATSMMPFQIGAASAVKIPARNPASSASDAPYKAVFSAAALTSSAPAALNPVPPTAQLPASLGYRVSRQFRPVIGEQDGSGPVDRVRAHDISLAGNPSLETLISGGACGGAPRTAPGTPTLALGRPGTSPGRAWAASPRRARRARYRPASRRRRARSTPT